MKEISEALDAFLAEALGGVRVAMPGRIESYDATKQRASVQPLIRRGVVGEDGTRGTELLPVVPDVPVVFPGSGDYSITWPIARGDVVLLVFADQSLDRWLPRGGVVDPQDDRGHALSDAIAIPGLRPFSAPVAGAPSAAGGAMVIQAPGQIHAGGTESLALQSDLEALAAHVDSLLVGGTGSAPSAPGTAPTGTGTAKLKGS